MRAANDRERWGLVFEPCHLVTCPDCAFTFDASHEDEGGGWSCPVCETEGLRAERTAVINCLNLFGSSLLHQALTDAGLLLNDGPIGPLRNNP